MLAIDHFSSFFLSLSIPNGRLVFYLDFGLSAFIVWHFLSACFFVLFACYFVKAFCAYINHTAFFLILDRCNMLIFALLRSLHVFTHSLKILWSMTIKSVFQILGFPHAKNR